MIATLGSGMMVISAHFISFFVSLEILTVSLYALVAYYREREKAIEAGLKYLILAGMSSSFLLFGIGLIYAISGTMSFSCLLDMTTVMQGKETIMLVAGIGMIIVGFGFKLALVPFHMWAPDVYEGASSPVSAFIATVSKGAVAAILLRLFMTAEIYRYEKIMLAFIIISSLSMLVGNLLALLQTNIKRLLAYSSIANFGYILVAFIAGKQMGMQACTFYITAYIVTILGAFGVITIISHTDGEAADIANYQGLFWRKPFLASALTIFLLSLAGIPLTAGFIGKYFLLSAGLGNSQWVLAFILIISSVIGLFYYLRVIAMMMKQEESNNAIETPRIPTLSSMAIAILLFAVVALGICPEWLINTIRNLVIQ
jgi:NADH-quinone oxidoreductase subunit N